MSVNLTTIFWALLVMSQVNLVADRPGWGMYYLAFAFVVFIIEIVLTIKRYD